MAQVRQKMLRNHFLHIESGHRFKVSKLIGISIGKIKNCVRVPKKFFFDEFIDFVFCDFTRWRPSHISFSMLNGNKNLFA